MFRCPWSQQAWCTLWPERGGLTRLWCSGCTDPSGSRSWSPAQKYIRQYIHREAGKLPKFNSNFATLGEVWFSESFSHIYFDLFHFRTPFRWAGFPRRPLSPGTRWMETSSINLTVLSGGHIVVCLFMLFMDILLFSLVSWLSLCNYVSTILYLQVVCLKKQFQ